VEEWSQDDDESDIYGEQLEVEQTQVLLLLSTLTFQVPPVEDIPQESKEVSPTETPEDAILQGRIAPPTTPHIAVFTPPTQFYPGMLGARYDEYDSDEQEIEAVPAESALDEDEYGAREFAETSVPEDSASQKEGEEEEGEVYAEDVESQEGDHHDYSTEQIAELAVPGIVAATAAGFVASKEMDAETDIDTTQGQKNIRVDESHEKASPVPLIKVITPKPPTLELPSQWSEPLKHHVQPIEMSPSVLTPPHSPTLVSPIAPVPAEPTHLPPPMDLTRPPTSYSWLGSLRYPIIPITLEGQTGWITNDVPSTVEIRKRHSRLRRKRDRLTEAARMVNKRQSLQRRSVKSMQSLKGERRAKKVYNSVMDICTGRWMGKVVGWMKGERPHEE
jgi:hypothetical protein